LANVTKTLNSTGGLRIGYRWYFNDSVGNTNSTQIYQSTSSSAPPIANQIECEQQELGKLAIKLIFQKYLQE